MIALIVSIIGMAITLKMTDMPNKHKLFDATKNKRTKQGRLFILFGVLAIFAQGFVGWDNYFSQNRLTDKIDSLDSRLNRVSEHAKQREDLLRKDIGVQWDSATGRYSKIDSQLRLQDNPTFVIGGKKATKPEKPLLTLFVNNRIKSPEILPTDKDTLFTFRIYLDNLRDAVAYNMRSSITLITPIKNGGLAVVKAHSNAFNETEIFDNNTIYIIESPITNLNYWDTVYVYFKLNYTDSANIKQKPFREFYITTSNHINKQLNGGEEIKFNELKNALLKTNLW